MAPWLVAAVVGLTLAGGAAGSFLRRRLAKLGYRLAEESDDPAPGRRWWLIPVGAGLWAALAWTVLAPLAEATGARSSGSALAAEVSGRIAVAVVMLAAVLIAAATAILAMGAIDLDVHRLPDRIMGPTAAGLALGLLLVALVAGDLTQWWRALLAGLACAGAYLLLALLTLLRGSLGVGLGDVKLAGVLGMGLGWFGWWQVAIGMYAGILIGGLIAGYLVLVRRRGGKDHLAFGPPMMVGALIGVLLDPSALFGFW